MEHCNCTARHMLIPATVTSDIHNKMENMTETLLDLQKAQQINSNSIQCVMQRVETIANDMEKLKNQISKQPPESSLTETSSLPVNKIRLPSDLSIAVKSMYWRLPANRQFRAEENYRSPHNQCVSAWLLQEIKKAPSLKQHSQSFTRAIYRYFESRRRKLKDQSRLDAVKVNGKNSKKRRVQKKFYEDRQSVLKDDEKPKWDQINHLYMTSESDTELDHQRINVTHTPTWRSAELNSLIDDLDRRLAEKRTQKEIAGFIRKERVAGPPSRSHPPAGAPEWAVNPAAYSRQSPEQHTQSEHPWSPLNGPYNSFSATPDDRMILGEPCQMSTAKSSDTLSKTKAASNGYEKQDCSSEDEFFSDSS